jgi:hypothetical protein
MAELEAYPRKCFAGGLSSTRNKTGSPTHQTWTQEKATVLFTELPLYNSVLAFGSGKKQSPSTGFWPPVDGANQCVHVSSAAKFERSVMANGASLSFSVTS